MFILPLMTGHLLWKAIILGGLYRGVPRYINPQVVFEIYTFEITVIYPRG